MKIDILTFSNATNFGAVLQSFALQYYLTTLGHDVKHIDFTYKIKQNTNMNFSYNSQENCIERLKTRINDKIKREKFKEFRKSYLRSSKTQYRNSIPLNVDDCDAYIVGSDQVWNADLNGERSEFYLNFVTKGKKVAYAASVGRDITEKDENLIMEHCDNLDFVSVREDSLNKFLIDRCKIDSIVTVDPVFLIDRERWSIIEKKAHTPSKYILCYLMEDSIGIREAALFLSKKLGGTIIWINGGGNKINRNATFPGKEIKRIGPQQFLYLIDHSLGVVTNSFHGAAFSLIFKKQLCVVDHSSRNERLVQLLEYAGAVEKRISFDEKTNDMDSKIIDGVNSNLEETIKNSKKFLQRALSD